MLDLKQTTQFKKDLRRMAKRGADMTLLDELITMLRERNPLPEKYMDGGGHKGRQGEPRRSSAT